jgi:hypothetical protein
MTRAKIWPHHWPLSAIALSPTELNFRLHEKWNICTQCMYTDRKRERVCNQSAAAISVCLTDWCNGQIKRNAFGIWHHPVATLTSRPQSISDLSNFYAKHILRTHTELCRWIGDKKISIGACNQSTGYCVFCASESFCDFILFVQLTRVHMQNIQSCGAISTTTMN